MAEEKKSIKLQRLTEKSVKEYTEARASAEGKPENGSACRRGSMMLPRLLPEHKKVRWPFSFSRRIASGTLSGIC